ncbi:MAG: PAS domain S-box protein, partial [Anaerolineales bacterium]
GMWAIIRDVSEHKRIEQNLRESERRYRELLDNSMQGVIVFQNMRIEYVNKAIMEVLGYNDAELKSFKPVEILQHVHPQDRRMFRDILQRRMINVPTSERYSMRVFHKNGEIRWIEARNVPIELQGKPALMITGIDVSEIRKVEAELLESLKIQQTILNATKALAFLVDTNGILIASNDKFAERMRFTTENVAGISMYDLLPEEVLMARKIPFDQVIGSGKPITFIDTREGTWFENSMYPVQDESGKVVSVAVFARDITEQRKVTEALRSSEEQYRTLAETAHDLIFIINREDCIQYVNSFGAKFLGKEPLELVGQPRARFFPSDTNQHQGDHIQHVFRTGEAYASEDANTFLAHTIWLNTWLVPLKDASGEVTSVLGISRDLTERKIAEQELQRARNLLEERVAERTQELSASQEKLRALTAQTIQAQEEERRSIARELHDDAGQALITLKFGLAAIESALPETHSSASQRLADAMKIIDQTNAHIRSLAHNLRPPVLEIGGIHLSLQDYCREQSERTQIPIYYQGVEIPGLPDEIGISLFRFVQEALTNILKHAHATEVKIRLQYKKGEISLSVSDNGRGMDKTLQPDGMGLLGIRERLSLFNGRLEIQSRKGRGAKLVACIPWRQPGGD